MSWDPAQIVTMLGAVAAAVTAIAMARKGNAEGRSLEANSSVALQDSGVRVATAWETRMDKLQTQVDALDSRIKARDRAAIVHERWDLEVVEILNEKNIVVPLPPPLIITDQTTGS